MIWMPDTVMLDAMYYDLDARYCNVGCKVLLIRSRGLLIKSYTVRF